jgi:hypothetical protein
VYPTGIYEPSTEQYCIEVEKTQHGFEVHPLPQKPFCIVNVPPELQTAQFPKNESKIL